MIWVGILPSAQFCGPMVEIWEIILLCSHQKCPDIDGIPLVFAQLMGDPLSVDFGLYRGSSGCFHINPKFRRCVS